MARRRTFVATAGLALLALPAAAGAYVPRILPGQAGPAPVRIVDHGRAVGVRTRVVRRADHGRVLLTCARAVDERGRRPAGTRRVRRILRRGLRVRIPHGFDWCRVRITTRVGRGETAMLAGTAVVLSAAGLDDRYEAEVASLMRAATSTMFDGRPSEAADTAREVASVLDGLPIVGRRLVARAAPGPDTAVAPGHLALWTDGTRTSATATTPAARRLHLDGDRRTRRTAGNLPVDDGP